MSVLHITTPDTFFIDAPEIESQCWICLRTGTQKIGWVASRCSLCGFDYCDEMRSIVISRREYLGLTRKQMAERFGCKTSTIRRYEWGSVSKKYFAALEQMVKENMTAQSHANVRRKHEPDCQFR